MATLFLLGWPEISIGFFHNNSFLSLEKETAIPSSLLLCPPYNSVLIPYLGLAEKTTLLNRQEQFFWNTILSDREGRMC